MIGKLKGTLSEIDQNVGYIETSTGIFYRVFLTPSMLSKLIGSEVEFYTYLHIREDAQILFGFESREQYQIFKLLLTVPGVGPKTAYSIICGSKTHELINAIRKNDVSFFSSISGIGRKTAMKIILELSSKMKTEFAFENMNISEDDQTVVAALKSLGFSQAECSKVLSVTDKKQSIENRIKESIKYLTSKKI